MADEIPSAQMDPEATWDPNLDSSAIYALRSLDPKSQYESAGIIYQNPEGKYARSLPITQNERDSFALNAKLPKGYKIAGIYHSHPGAETESQVFSPQDLDMAEKLKVPSYILFTDGSIRSYTPGKTKTKNISLAGRSLHSSLRVADGDQISVPDDQARKIAVQKAYADQQQKGLQDGGV